MSKIRQYFSTLEITRGLAISLLGSLFIYLEYWGFCAPIINTFTALLSFYFLLYSPKRIWFWYGVGIGGFWFWWVSLSLQHYGYAWGFPVGFVLVTLVYGLLLYGIAFFSHKLSAYHYLLHTSPDTISLALKALGLLSLSYIHPFGMDWFKPELMFIQSYIGINKWQFALVLLAISLSIHRGNLLFLLGILLAYSPTTHHKSHVPKEIVLHFTHISVEDKWNPNKQNMQLASNFKAIDDAIAANKDLIVLPESVFPLFLNRHSQLLTMLKERAKKIAIVTGGLYWHNNTPYNSTYIFTKDKMQVANKVLLVPFGESNPLPKFMSDWVNKVFYDGSVDYVASSHVTDYEINGTTYRNAICFEATSERLYQKDKNGKRPKNMIVLSNNGWFTPSTEPTLQKLLLLYYSKKYGTTIYHSVNMSEAYRI